MNRAARALGHVALADFLERVRRGSFLAILGLVGLLAYSIFTGAWSMRVGDFTGRPNAAWIAGLTALVTSFMLSLFGFYLVKNAIERDRATGVGQILAATPLSRPLYTLGKAASNFAVLATMVGALAGVTLLIALLRGLPGSAHPWTVVSPFLLVALPPIALVAAAAVFFESVRWLAGGFGNVAFFFAWCALLTFAMASGRPWLDPLGMLATHDSLAAAAGAEHPEVASGELGMSLNLGPQREAATPFTWEGFAWTPGRVAERLAWLVAAAALALGAALPFDRFDRRFDRSSGRSRRPDRGRTARRPAAAEAGTGPSPPATTSIRLTPVPAGSRRSRMGALVAAELRLMLRGWPWWWYLALAGLVLASALAPLGTARSVLVPLAWLGCVLVFSPLGNRARRAGTFEILAASYRPAVRQPLAAWLAGVAVAVAVAAPALVRLLATGQPPAALALGAGALFVPGLALCLGVWTGGAKAFEVVFTLLWYVGPLNRVPALDFSGATAEAVARGSAWLWLALAAAAVAAALARSFPAGALGDLSGSSPRPPFARPRQSSAACTPARVHGQRGASPLQAYALRPVIDSDCVAVRRGGE